MFPALLAASAAVAACYPSPDLTVEDFDTVVTVVADSAVFGGYSTYFMPDTVFQRPADGGATRVFDDLIISDIRRNMAQLGYVHEADPESNPPDLLVAASAITRDQYTAYLGWPYFGQGWGGQFVYPTVGVSYLYTLGTIIIDLADAEDFDPEDEDVAVLWTASISGPLQGKQANRGTRITNGIDQAFAQSPYLKAD